KVAAAAAAIKGARALSMRINAWEWRWPLNTYRERDAKKLSQALLDRLAEAERMSLDQYREDLAERDKVRASYAELAPDCDAWIENACQHAGRPFDPDIRPILRLGGVGRLIEGR